MEQIDIDIKTLTPIHTGNIDPAESSIRATGLMGGLRWWYGLIYRTLNHKICDNPKEDKNPEKLCGRCALFGNTAQRRKFDLLIEDNAVVTCSDVIRVEKKRGGRGWHLPQGRMGEFKLRISGNSDATKEIILLFLFLERYGTLGAKPQLGFGRFRITNRDVLRKYVSVSQITLGNEIIKKPNLIDSRFYTITFDESPFTEKLKEDMKTPQAVKDELTVKELAPVSPLVKEYLRFGPHKQNTKSFILGKKKQRARIASSWAYRDDSSWRIDVFAGPILGKYEERDWKLYNNILSNEMKWKKILGLQDESTISVSSTYIDSPTRMKSLLEGVLQ